MVSVLEQPEALPRALDERAVADVQRDVAADERALDVRRHVVAALERVLVRPTLQQHAFYDQLEIPIAPELLQK